MRLALPQLNPLVGDVAGNAAAVRAVYAEAVAAGAHVVATTELALTGYPPEDLLLKHSFVAAAEGALRDVAAVTRDVPLVVGTVTAHDAPAHGSTAPPLANAAAVCRHGVVEAVYRKQRLPNYGVFDEARYFRPGSEPLVIEAAGVPVGVTVCEDLWGEGGPVAQACAAGARLVLNLNASPYSRGKRAEREHWARHHATACGVWLAYGNAVGGQDELVFDGDSFVMAPDGRVVRRGRQFQAELFLADVPLGAAGAPPLAVDDVERLDPVAEVYAALVLGTRDYVTKNGFSRALVGVSGGVDSALVATLAADALGPAAVTAVAMPSPYSSPGSLVDAKALAANLGVGWLELPIAPAMEAFDATLADVLDAAAGADLARENIQSRIRGTLLMALSNARGDIVLATGNKSEYAVGYSTLYGDMAGGFAVIKDVPKLLVYQLCRHRNRRGTVIPQAILDKPPSAELRPGQLDTDSLPPYEVLDPILQAYVERDASVDDIAAAGFDADAVRRVAALVDRAEYKRRQAAPGVKITTRAFGKDRRLPITQAWTR